jgi:glycosyltransferase involved in cell wall biosynthesis
MIYIMNKSFTRALPLVSVLMLTRNHSKFISKSIASVQSQTVENWELLVGEDASSDHTGAIVENIASFDSRISVFPSLNGPLGFHQNFARLLAAARAPYVAFLEGDDWWCEPHKLELQLALLESDSTLSFCGGYTFILDQRQGSANDHLPCIGPDGHLHRLSFIDLISSYSFHFSSIVMRRRAVLLPEWIFGQYCLDRPLYLLAALCGDAGVVHSVLSVYRLHGGGVWAPLRPLHKAKCSMHLFYSFCRHFDPSYVALFRVALSHILWGYLALALSEKRRGEALKIIWMALRASPRLRLLRQPFLTLAALLRASMSSPCIL